VGHGPRLTPGYRVAREPVGSISGVRAPVYTLAWPVSARTREQAGPANIAADAQRGALVDRPDAASP